MRKLSWRVAHPPALPVRMSPALVDFLRDAIEESGLPWPGPVDRRAPPAWHYDAKMRRVAVGSAVLARVRQSRIVTEGERQAIYAAVDCALALVERAARPVERTGCEHATPEQLAAYVRAGGGGAGSFERFCRERGFLYPVAAEPPVGPADDPPRRDAATQVRRPLPTGPRLPPAPSCDPAGTLVIRRRGEGVARG